jgi:translation initiation factor IF-3
MVASTSNFFKINYQIRSEQVRLIDQNSVMVGIVDTKRAISLAKDCGLDLVEISPKAVPPVCKILDSGKFKYEMKKKATQDRKKQKNFAVKEIKLRPNIGENDLLIKSQRVSRLLSEGHKVKVAVYFRGRERARPEVGEELLKKIFETLTDEKDDKIHLDQNPGMYGSSMSMVISLKI